MNTQKLLIVIAATSIVCLLAWLSNATEAKLAAAIGSICVMVSCLSCIWAAELRSVLESKTGSVRWGLPRGAEPVVLIVPLALLLLGQPTSGIGLVIWAIVFFLLLFFLLRVLSRIGPPDSKPSKSPTADKYPRTLRPFLSPPRPPTPDADKTRPMRDR